MEHDEDDSSKESMFTDCILQFNPHQGGEIMDNGVGISAMKPWFRQKYTIDMKEDENNNNNSGSSFQSLAALTLTMSLG